MGKDHASSFRELDFTGSPVFNIAKVTYPRKVSIVRLLHSDHFIAFFPPGTTVDIIY